MSLPVTVHPEAEAEVRDAARWYEQRQTGSGLALLAATDVALESIEEWPHSGSPVEQVRPGREVRRMAVDRFRYGLVYVVHEDHAHVVAFAHNRL